MAMIVVVCRNCGKRLKADARHAGKKGKCPGCGQPIVLEEQAAPAAPAPQPAADSDDPLEAAMSRAAEREAKAREEAAAREAAKASERAAAAAAADKPATEFRMLMFEKQGDIAIVRFVTSKLLDAADIDAFGKELDALIDDHYLTRVIINFDRINYLSSASIGKIISFNRRIQKEKGKLRLCGLSDDILHVFKIMNLDKVLEICDSEENALVSIMKRV